MAGTQQLPGHLAEKAKGRQGGPHLPAGHCPTPWSWPPAHRTVQRFWEMTSLAKARVTFPPGAGWGQEGLRACEPWPAGGLSCALKEGIHNKGPTGELKDGVGSSALP